MEVTSLESLKANSVQRVPEFGQLLRHHFNLVGQLASLEQYRPISLFREQLLDHRRLLIQRSQVGRGGVITPASGADAGQIQRHAIIRHRRAHNSGYRP